MNEQLPIQLSLDVSLPERAQRIRDLVGVARTCIIEIGRELIAAKAQVGHGEWLPWLRDEFGWSEDTAHRYMRVGRAFQIPQRAEFDGLTIEATALYALSAPDVPQEARDEAVTRAEYGEHVSKADAEAMIAKAVEAERDRFEALVAELQAAAAEISDGPPTIPALVEQLCQATGKNKQQSSAHTYAWPLPTFLFPHHRVVVAQREPLRGEHRGDILARLVAGKAVRHGPIGTQQRPPLGVVQCAGERADDLPTGPALHPKDDGDLTQRTSYAHPIRFRDGVAPTQDPASAGRSTQASCAGRNRPADRRECVSAVSSATATEAAKARSASKNSRSSPRSDRNSLRVGSGTSGGLAEVFIRSQDYATAAVPRLDVRQRASTAVLTDR
jgi:hypothetical protein